MLNAFINISGYLNVLAGITLLTYWYAFAIFLPYRDLSTTLAILVKNRNWVWINTLGVIGATAGLLGQAGIYLFQVPNANWFSVTGFYIAVTGTMLLIGTMLWDTVLMPILVKFDETLLDFRGPIYSSRVYLPFFILSGLIYGLGYILVGIGIVQSGSFPTGVGYLIAFGAPTFGLGTMFGKLQVYIRSLGITLLSAGLIWVGYIMLM